MAVDCQEEPHVVPLFEACPTSSPSKKTRVLTSRPEPPPIYRSTKPLTEPKHDADKLFFHRTRKYAVGDAVDAFINICWWEVHITALNGQEAQVEAKQPPEGEGGAASVSFKHLRPTFIWKKDTWTLPPTKDGLPPLGVFEVAPERFSLPTGFLPRSAKSDQPADDTVTATSLAAEDIRRGFETLLENVPRRSHPGGFQRELRGLSKQKIQPFPTSPPGSGSGGAPARTRALSKGSSGKEGTKQKDLEPVSEGLGWGGKASRGPRVRNGSAESGTAEKPSGGNESDRPNVTPVRQKQPKKPQKCKEEPAAENPGQFLPDLLGGWESVSVDVARRAFEQLNGWTPDEAMMRSRCVDIRAWYRAKFEKMLQSTRRFVRFLRANKHEFKSERWDRGHVSVGDWPPQNGKGQLEADDKKSGAGTVSAAAADVTKRMSGGKEPQPKQRIKCSEGRGRATEERALSARDRQLHFPRSETGPTLKPSLHGPALCEGVKKAKSKRRFSTDPLPVLALPCPLLESRQPVAQPAMLPGTDRLPVLALPCPLLESRETVAQPAMLPGTDHSVAKQAETSTYDPTAPLQHHSRAQTSQEGFYDETEAKSIERGSRVRMEPSLSGLGMGEKQRAEAEGGAEHEAEPEPQGEEKVNLQASVRAEGEDKFGTEADAKVGEEVKTGVELSAPSEGASMDPSLGERRSCSTERSHQRTNESGADFVSCLEPSEAEDSARALLDTWTPDALDEARGLFYMVNGWLPDEDELGAVETSEWFRQKLERLVKAGERCCQIEGGEGVRFVAWVGGEAAQLNEKGGTEEGDAEERCQERGARDAADLGDFRGGKAEPSKGETTETVRGAVDEEPSVPLTAMQKTSEDPCEASKIEDDAEKQRGECPNLDSEGSPKGKAADGGEVEAGGEGSGEGVFERAFENFVNETSEAFWTGESEQEWANSNQKGESDLKASRMEASEQGAEVSSESARVEPSSGAETQAGLMWTQKSARGLRRGKEVPSEAPAIGSLGPEDSENAALALEDGQRKDAKEENLQLKDSKNEAEAQRGAEAGREPEAEPRDQAERGAEAEEEALDSEAKREIEVPVEKEQPPITANIQMDGLEALEVARTVVRMEMSTEIDDFPLALRFGLGKAGKVAVAKSGVTEGLEVLGTGRVWAGDSSPTDAGSVQDGAAPAVSAPEELPAEERKPVVSDLAGQNLEHAQNRDDFRKHLLRNVCALANASRERKAEAVRRMGFRRRSPFIAEAFDAQSAAAVIEAVERAGLPCLSRNAATGRFEVGRNANGTARHRMPDGWYEEVVREVGYRGASSQKAAAENDGCSTGTGLTTREKVKVYNFVGKLMQDVVVMLQRMQKAERNVVDTSSLQDGVVLLSAENCARAAARDGQADGQRGDYVQEEPGEQKLDAPYEAAGRLDTKLVRGEASCTTGLKEAHELLRKLGGAGSLGLENAAASVLRLRAAEVANEARNIKETETDGEETTPRLFQGRKEPLRPAKEESEGAAFENASEGENRQLHLRFEDLPLAVLLNSSKAGGMAEAGGGGSRADREAEGIYPGTVLPAGEDLQEERPTVKDMCAGADDVAEPERAKKTRVSGRFLRAVCALANARKEEKAEALRKMQTRPGNRFSEGGFDARRALTLLEAVERAALPSLTRNAATGRFEEGRTADGIAKTRLPDGWHDAVTFEVGYKATSAERASQDIRSSLGPGPVMTPKEKNYMSNFVGNLVQQVNKVLEKFEQAEDAASECLQSLGLESRKPLLLLNEAPRAKECASKSQLRGQHINSKQIKRKPTAAKTGLTEGTATDLSSKEGNPRKRAKHGSVSIDPDLLRPVGIQNQPSSKASFEGADPRTLIQGALPIDSALRRGIEVQGPGAQVEAAAAAVEPSQIQTCSGKSKGIKVLENTGPWASLGLAGDPAFPEQSSIGRGPTENERCEKRDKNTTLLKSASAPEESEPEPIVLNEFFPKKRATGARDVAESARRAPIHKRPPGRLLQMICALSNERRERKAGALRRMQSERASNRVALDARRALALLEAVERAAQPYLAHNAVTGRLEVKESANGSKRVTMGAWHDAVVREVGFKGCWAHLAPKEDGQNTEAREDRKLTKEAKRYMGQFVEKLVQEVLHMLECMSQEEVSLMGALSMLGLETGSPLLAIPNEAARAAGSDHKPAKRKPEDQALKRKEKRSETRWGEDVQEGSTPGECVGEGRPMKRAKHESLTQTPEFPSRSETQTRPSEPASSGQFGMQAGRQDSVRLMMRPGAFERNGNGSAEIGELFAAACAILTKAGIPADTGGMQDDELTRLRSAMRPVFRSSVRWFNTALEDLRDYATEPNPPAGGPAAAPARDWEADFEAAPDVLKLLGVLANFDRSYAALLGARAVAVHRAVASTMEKWNVRPREEATGEERPGKRARADKNAGKEERANKEASAHKSAPGKSRPVERARGPAKEAVGVPQETGGMTGELPEGVQVVTSGVADFWRPFVRSARERGFAGDKSREPSGSTFFPFMDRAFLSENLEPSALTTGERSPKIRCNVPRSATRQFFRFNRC
ncbi:hypothetical protein KFL_002460040 [Klebsormidium nitens]|uniref:Uncharacterized protein n=1 Tax=Klebsormidium nitens TaxID=105231 RepID=A0A1Y1IA86_KLENI|nr:hypothetical protein KFL_002460040 [Klebsormidium nitens]|eukprot:GAQ85627.1 hypothetical protein KFL_002460040 [Klebsormidium nitens]